VRRAGSTKTEECGAQRSSRPVQAHSQIVGGDAEPLRNFIAWLTEEIDLPDQLRVLGRQRRQNPVEATANGTLGVIVDEHRPLLSRLQTLERHLSYTGATIVVGQSPAKYLRQPSFQGFRFPDRSGTPHRLEIKVLQYVLSILNVSRSLTDEP
jgi:hypothetical protein